MKGLVSVIIPVYNNLHTVIRCLVSVRDQLYRDIEVLLVDDGSSDGTGYIVSRFCSWDSRFRYIRNIENMGVSYSRNKGLENVRGKYIMFLDSDDYLYSDFIVTCLNEIGDSDLLISGMRLYSVKPNGIAKNLRVGAIEGKDIWRNAIDNKYLTGVIGGKLYTREVLKGTKFNNAIRFQEDLDFNLRVLQNCKKVYLSDYIGYVYVKESSKKPDCISMVNNDILLYNLAGENGISQEERSGILTNIAKTIYTSIYWEDSEKSAESLAKMLLYETCLASLKDDFENRDMPHKALICSIIKGSPERDIQKVRLRRKLSAIKHGWSL